MSLAFQEGNNAVVMKSSANLGETERPSEIDFYENLPTLRCKKYLLHNERENQLIGPYELSKE